jgi:Mannosyl-glycoprotein endo-beta-N-acetylglucosaminidase
VARRHVHPDAPRLRRALRYLGPLGLVVALTTSSVVAAAAATPTSTTTSTTPAPPTTVVLLPPPPRFPPGDDFGRTLKSRRLAALAALQASSDDITNNLRLVSLRSDHVKVASHMLAHAHEHQREVARRLVSIHEQVKAMAVEAYMMGASVQITGTLSSFASAKDVVGLSRNLTLVHSSHDRLLELVDIERREQSRARLQVREASKARAEAVREWRAATTGLAEARQRNAQARADLDQVERDWVRFFELATTSASPIMGPNQLTADDLVAYIDSLGVHPQLTVPIQTLAAYYISEGEAEGVRGDVAFAQSILETGAFMFPGHGLLDPEDNNYAGINACDSCKHGDRFSSALIGVRAQMQLLRIYADPSLETIDDFANPLALLTEPHLGFSGHVQTWYSLGGRWATGPNYGFHVYDIYMQMVRLAQSSRNP